MYTATRATAPAIPPHSAAATSTLGPPVVPRSARSLVGGKCTRPLPAGRLVGQAPAPGRPARLGGGRRGGRLVDDVPVDLVDLGPDHVPRVLAGGGVAGVAHGGAAQRV